MYSLAILAQNEAEFSEGRMYGQFSPADIEAVFAGDLPASAPVRTPLLTLTGTRFCLHPMAKALGKAIFCTCTCT